MRVVVRTQSHVHNGLRDVASEFQASDMLNCDSHCFLLLLRGHDLRRARHRVVPVTERCEAKVRARDVVRDVGDVTAHPQQEILQSVLQNFVDRRVLQRGPQTDECPQRRLGLHARQVTKLPAALATRRSG